MSFYYQDDHITLHHGDCIETMRTMPDDSIDSIVTDPPYGLGFMGKKWDSLPPGEEWARECLRVLKPGGHLLAFGGSRTWHRLAVAIEDAGFEIRDGVLWLYGSGFPKSHDVGKAIDKARDEDAEPRRAVARALREALDSSGKTRREIDQHFGTANVSQYWFSPDRNTQTPPADKWPWLRDFLNIGPGLDAEVWLLNGRKGQPGENWGKREIVGTRTVNGAEGSAGGYANGIASHRGLGGVTRDVNITAPATPEAVQWDGWGTALKPAYEPAVMARKPFTGTVAGNVLEHGTGAINIDASRVESDGSHKRSFQPTNNGRNVYGAQSGFEPTNASGRFPANLILDEHTAELLDEQSGELPKSGGARRRGAKGDGVTGWKSAGGPASTDSGGASRFFYVAKAPKSERPVVDGVAHPTVKPLALMRWLCKLVTPEHGTILDTFAGSGTTIEAAMLEGFNVIGIERETEYLPLIEARIARAKSLSQEVFDFGGIA